MTALIILLALGYLAAVWSIVGLVCEAKRYRAAQWLDRVIEHDSSDWWFDPMQQAKWED